MNIINSAGKWLMKKRLNQIEHFMQNPEEAQSRDLQYLLKTAQNTFYGKKFRFGQIDTIREFQEQVPLTTYEDLFPYIQKQMKGEQNVLWPSPIKWFAKSSGTTSDKSKFIPVSQESLEGCHYKGGRDMLALYIRNYPDTKIFTGKNLSVGGSQENSFGDKRSPIHTGNISAIMMQNLPFWAQSSRTPGLEVTMMNNWEEKVKKIAEITSRQNVASMAGSPMWILLLLQYMMKKQGVRYIQEIWPNLEVFFHGSVSFTPYRPLFQQIDYGDSLRYMEIYNATEGFFGLQDQPNDPALLLMLNYGIFYEFIPAEDFNKEQPRVLTLQEVEAGKNYSLIISTSSGLWRYKIGDTIRFTSVRPYRFNISGRTKHCINIFGEDLFIEHAEKGLAAACKETGAIIENYTAAPRYYDQGKKGTHEWVVEFVQPPQDLRAFTKALDKGIQEVNEDYFEKRKGNTAIEEPVVREVAPGTFYTWLKKHDKLGGQHKIPRLSNSRELVEELLSLHPEKREVG